MALRANFRMDRGKSTCLRLLLYFHHPGNNDCMDRDQPLIHFYHKTFLPISDRKTVKPPPYVNEAKLTHEDQVAHVNGVKIRFHRCVVRSLKVNICSLTRWNEQDHPSSRYALSCRLNVEVTSECWPDNDKTHALPPDMGPFKLL